MSHSPSATSPRLRVAVLLGGPSTEHDVSLASGLQVLDALDPARWDALPVHLERGGRWRVGRRPEPPSLAAKQDGSAPSSEEALGAAGAAALAEGLAALSRPPGVDVVFLALHGAVGEDGVIQGLLELSGLPYTGSGVLASALAMDKVKTKEVYRGSGVPCARDAVLRRRDLAAAAAAEGGLESLAQRLAAEVGLPAVVKPVIGGSSVATRRVTDEASLAAAIEEALAVDERALVEECVEGVELTCGVLGGGPHEEAQALPVTEIAPVGGGFFDFHAKYTAGACEEITPARIDEAATAEVQRLSLLAHEALGCEGLSRTDFILRGGVPVALETNTLPGMTATSLLPQAAAAAGLSFPQLVDRLLESALLRERRRRDR